jgi:hypothetical protein
MVVATPPATQEPLMPVQLTDLASQLQTLFGADADRAAAESQFIRRQRKLSGSAFAQGLVFGWLDKPQSSLDELVGSLARSGVTLTPQSLHDRFTPQAAEFFRLLLGQALGKVVAASGRPALALLRRFAGVYLLDSTLIGLPAALAALLPGCGGRDAASSCQAALKVTVRLELAAGCLEGINLNPGRTADAKTELQQAPLPQGALRLADLGFFDLGVLQGYDKQKVYFITRPVSNLLIYTSKGKKCKLARYLAGTRKDRVDEWVFAGCGKKLHCRLLAIRCPDEVTAGRQDRARKEALDHGRQASEERLTICGWTVFLSNAPGWLLRLQEAWVLYRVRWQIELLFKLWKSDGQLDESRSGKPYRVLAEVYAKLLGMVVQHWLLLGTGGAAFGKKSARKAARAVRRQVAHVAAVLPRAAEVVLALEVMARMVRAAGQVNSRRGRPSTYQTLLDPDHDGLSPNVNRPGTQPPPAGKPEN